MAAMLDWRLAFTDLLLQTHSWSLAGTIPSNSRHGGAATDDIRLQGCRDQDLSTRRASFFPRRTFSIHAVHQVHCTNTRIQIQNTRVRDMEFEIPLPPLASDPKKPDLSIVQRAWWDVINLVYREAKDGRSPMRLTLELRIMGGSDMLMAPQYGNDLGTASIEILTIPNAVPEQWEAFKQEVADIWMGYEINGAKLNARPHWAKEW